jgi:hypothetical protein
MDRRAASILKRARALHQDSPLSGLAWNKTASTQEEIAGETSALTSEQRAGFLKHAEDQLLEEGMIAHVDQS